MKAILVSKPGSFEELRIEDIDEPVTAKGDVKIRIRAFGLNRAETYYRAGKMGEINEPRIPGIEAVGEVVEDSSGRFHKGQKVITAMGGMMLQRHGSYAEYITAPVSHVLAVDSKLSWEQLAALPEAYLTVWGALDKTMGIENGQSLLVRGGTTTLGMAAITYARAKGLSVVATTRNPQNKQLLHSKGANHVVIDEGEIAEKVHEIFPEGVDYVLEVVGAATIKDSAKAVKTWGQVCVVGILSGLPVFENFNLMSDLPNTVRINFFSSHLFGEPAMQLSDSPIQWIIEQIENNKIPSLLSKTFEFDQIQQAHQIIENNQVLGKAVVRV